MLVEVMPGVKLPYDLLEALIERCIEALDRADGNVDDEDGRDAEEAHQGIGEALWDGEPTRDVSL